MSIIDPHLITLETAPVANVSRCGHREHNVDSGYSFVHFTSQNAEFVLTQRSVLHLPSLMDAPVLYAELNLAETRGLRCTSAPSLPQGKWLYFFFWHLNIFES